MIQHLGMLECSQSSANSFEARLNVVTVYEYTTQQIPLCETNRRNASKNCPADMSSTNSKCTAHVTAHVNNTKYDLRVLSLSLKNTGPTKSTPTI